MRERIKEDTKTSMKAGDKTRTGVLRLVSAAFQSAEIEAKGPLSPAAELAVMTKMVKQRRDSIAQYTSGGRPDLAAIEEAEIAIIEAYLPKQLSEAESRAAIAAVIKDLGASGPKDMGKVMAALKERFAGKLDFGAASGWVKDLLN
ncbi:MAG: GatB/YqeY domain-containing protein [Hyphomicrobium sp.]